MLHLVSLEGEFRNGICSELNLPYESFVSGLISDSNLRARLAKPPVAKARVAILCANFALLNGNLQIILVLSGIPSESLVSSQADWRSLELHLTHLATVSDQFKSARSIV